MRVAEAVRVAEAEVAEGERVKHGLETGSLAGACFFVIDLLLNSLQLKMSSFNISLIQYFLLSFG